jgi:hypothetical protein
VDILGGFIRATIADSSRLAAQVFDASQVARLCDQAQCAAASPDAVTDTWTKMTWFPLKNSQ